MLSLKKKLKGFVYLTVALVTYCWECEEVFQRFGIFVVSHIFWQNLIEYTQFLINILIFNHADILIYFHWQYLVGTAP